MLICTGGQRRPLLPGAASCPHHRTICLSPPTTTGALDGCLSTGHIHTVPTQPESLGHHSGRAKGRMSVYVPCHRLQHYREGRTGTSAISNTNDHARVHRFLGALHCCSLSLTAARGVILLSAPFTDQKTEAQGDVTTKATLLGLKARGSELSPLRFVLFPLCSKLSSSLPYCSGRN